MPQRQFQRISHSIPAVVKLTHSSGAANTFQGEVTDISVSGVCVLLPEASFGPLGPGAKARVIIEKAGSTQKLESGGSVVRSVVNADSSHQLAIRFERVRYDVVAALNSHQKVVVELNPFGWQDYRKFLDKDA